MIKRTFFAAFCYGMAVDTVKSKQAGKRYLMKENKEKNVQKQACHDYV
jgi:hypothetical protein